MICVLINIVNKLHQQFTPKWVQERINQGLSTNPKPWAFVSLVSTHTLTLYWAEWATLFNCVAWNYFSSTIQHMYVFGKLILLLVQYTRWFSVSTGRSAIYQEKCSKIDTICLVKISVINFVSNSAGSFYLLLAWWPWWPLDSTCPERVISKTQTLSFQILLH